ncbi:MAG: tetratricopeptide repeat protein [Nitrospira sp.]|nr:tetratricopeptide repeat protein [Nitrospira sp.]
MSHIARTKEPSGWICVQQACAGPWFPLGLAALLGGYVFANEEAVKKSQGYYQEGLASLVQDRPKAFVAFQRSVQVNPNNKESRYALGHVYVLQRKLAKAEGEFRAALSIDEDYSEAHT